MKNLIIEHKQLAVNLKQDIPYLNIGLCSCV